nr:MAG TPA: hypothetical protein [Caudoviricetes sp.]
MDSKHKYYCIGYWFMSWTLTVALNIKNVC